MVRERIAQSPDASRKLVDPAGLMASGLLASLSKNDKDRRSAEQKASKDLPVRAHDEDNQKPA
jgi:hypothetical protein